MPLASRFVRENESLPLSPSLAGYTRGNPSFYKLVAHRGWPDSKPGWPRPRRRAEPSRAEPSRPKVRSFALPRILRLTARAERSGGERIGSSPPSSSRVYTRAKRTVSRLHRVKAQLPRALLLVRRTTSILPPCILRSLGRSGNAEPRREILASPRLASHVSPRLVSSRLASLRLVSPAPVRSFFPCVFLCACFPFVLEKLGRV